LPQTAGEFMGVLGGPYIRVGNAGADKQAFDFGGHAGFGQQVMSEDRLRDFAADCAQGIERYQRVLQYEADLPATHCAPSTRRKTEQVNDPAIMTDNCHRARIDLRFRTSEANKGTGSHRFTRTRLPDERENFAGFDSERHAPNRLDRPLRCWKNHMQILDAEERHGRR
jgi:hypothetical protein